MSKQRILIGDDHAIVRIGLRQLIDAEPDMMVAGEAATSVEILRTLSASHWDLVMLDIALPDRNGVDTLHLIRHAHGAVPVLMISGFPEEQYAINLLRAGANGYLGKDAEPEEMLRAIRTALQGRRYMSVTVGELLADSLDGEFAREPHLTLSEREFQVLCLLASGHSVSQIAAQLFVSVKTVSTYRARTLQKLGLHSNADLICYAIRNRLMQ